MIILYNKNIEIKIKIKIKNAMTNLLKITYWNIILIYQLKVKKHI